MCATYCVYWRRKNFLFLFQQYLSNRLRQNDNVKSKWRTDGPFCPIFQTFSNGRHVSYLNKNYINVHTKSERLASKINGTFWHLGKWRGFFLKSQSPPGILRMRTNVAFTSPFAQYIFQSFTPYLVNVHLFCALIRTILKDFKTFLAFRQQPLNNQSKK